jgi:plastocyanin
VRLEILAIATAVAVSACSGATTATATKSPRISKAPTPANAQEVVIYEYKFIPYTLTVPAGTTVTWTNHDIAPHTATYRSFGENAFDSGNIQITQIYRHRFLRPGTYDYLCILHQGMRGTIVVR